MTLNITEFNPMLKEYYTSRQVEELAYNDHPLLAMVRKETDWGGREDAYTMPAWLTSTQAIGADFTTAIQNKGNGTYLRFQMGQRKRYAFAQLDRLVMKASMKSPKSFLKAYTAEVNGAMNQYGRDLAWNLYRSETGKRATVGSITEPGGVDTLLVLSNRADIVGFEVGMKLVFSDSAAAPGVTPVPGGLAPRTIDAIDRSAGSLRFNGELLVTTDGVAAGDHAHRDADLVAAGSFICVQGLEDHIPATAPGATPFQGVDRSIDTDRLAGIRIDGTSLTMSEAFIDAGQRLREAGKRPDHIFCNPVRFGQLVKETSSDVVRDKVKSPSGASIGYDTVKVYTPAGVLPVVSDPDCPHDVAWMLNVKDLVLASTGKMPEIADEDTKMLRSPTQDEYEVRIAGYGNLGIFDHGAQARIAL